jgi:Zn finger protein HypA/HybF involved in hydrogenase expression
MHEVGITKDLVDSIDKQVKDNREVKEVAKVNVNLGQGLGITEDVLKFWFSHFAKGTKLEGAEVSVRIVEGRALAVESLEVN